MDSTAEFLRRIVQFALAEDVGAGDVTTAATTSAGASGHARLRARHHGVLSGREVADAVFGELSPDVEIEWAAEDGDRLAADQVVATLQGPLGALLTGERVALNFVSRMSGIATLTRRYVEAVDGHQARILDTRKTTPGLRHLEKYAVRCGGGENHRVGLYDMFLVKENHIRAAGGTLPAARAALRAAAATRPRLSVEIEVSNAADALSVAELPVDRIMFDNMPVDQMRRTVLEIREVSAHNGRFVALEASGNVSLDNVHAIAETGVDFISVGALTHSAPAYDFSLLLA